MLVLALLLSCGPAKVVEAPPAEPAPVEVAEIPAPEPACLEQCLESQAMRAVAWEVIQADCARSCGVEEDPVGAVKDLEEAASP